MEYEYPIEIDWSTDEIIKVIQFYEAIEKAYEEGIEKELLIDRYKEFKKIVDSKAMEKKLDKEFETVSGYSIYKVIKKSNESNIMIKMQVEK